MSAARRSFVASTPRTNDQLVGGELDGIEQVAIENMAGF